MCIGSGLAPMHWSHHNSDTCPILATCSNCDGSSALEPIHSQKVKPWTKEENKCTTKMSLLLKKYRLGLTTGYKTPIHKDIIEHGPTST